MLLTIYPNGKRRDIAVAVQKSGFAWALDRDNGDIVWFKVLFALNWEFAILCANDFCSVVVLSCWIL